MYTLYFPNGNTQTYPDSSSLDSAVRAWGGKTVRIGNRMYAYCED